MLVNINFMAFSTKSILFKLFIFINRTFVVYNNVSHTIEKSFLQLFQMQVQEIDIKIFFVTESVLLLMLFPTALIIFFNKKLNCL